MSFLRVFWVRLRGFFNKPRAKPQPIVVSSVKPKQALKEELQEIDFTVPVEAPLQEPWLKGSIIQEIQRFLQTQRSDHTRRAYESDLRQYVGWLRAENRAGDSFDALLAYRDWLVTPADKGGKALSRVSANRKFATIRSFLNWLQSRGQVKENPSVWVKNFRAKTESPTQAFTDIEVADILSRPNRYTRSGLSHSLMLHLLFYLGLRRSELVALRADHFGFARSGGDGAVLTVRVPGKGDKERLLPVPPKVRAVLEEYMEREGIELGSSRPLFQPVRNNLTKIKAKPVHAASVYYVVRKYAAMAGVDRKVSPHSCRATCISNALDHAASHRSVQQLAGWSSPLMIERYDKRRTELKDSAAYTIEY